jgi:hypothetical protein
LVCHGKRCGSNSTSLLPPSILILILLLSMIGIAMYNAKCKAELLLDTKLIPIMRETVGIHDGKYVAPIIDLGKYGGWTKNGYNLTHTTYYCILSSSKPGITIDTLMEAAATGDLILMLECLESGLGVDDRDPNNRMTALMHTSKGGHFKCTVSLLNQRANLDLSDHEGKRAIHFACEAGQTELIKELVKWGVDVECPDK